jgi:hypothetical protein
LASPEAMPSATVAISGLVPEPGCSEAIGSAAIAGMLGAAAAVAKAGSSSPRDDGADNTSSDEKAVSCASANGTTPRPEDHVAKGGALTGVA